jgi:RimJ/RimL family protein N-acetyltransferase
MPVDLEPIPVSAPREGAAAPLDGPLTESAHPFRVYRRAMRAQPAPSVPSVPSVPSGDSVTEWRPSWTGVPPALVRTGTTWIWWLFHNLRVFRSRRFRMLMIVRDGRLLHRSTVFPPFFRFPFMARSDVQIGDTWTVEDARGRGLAGLALRAAIESTDVPGANAWYVVHESNHASIRVVEREGFELVGRGVRRPRLGSSLLGYYAITAPSPATGGGAS